MHGRVPHDPNEIIAVVDENDRIIGVHKRKHHAGGRLHREAAVLIIDGRGLILIQKRRDNGKLDYSAAGHFRYDRTYLFGAMLETFEELGLVIPGTAFKEVLKRRIKTGTKYPNDRFVKLFEVVGDYRVEEMKIDPKEVSKVEYMNPKKLWHIIQRHPRKMSPGFALILIKYFELRGVRK